MHCDMELCALTSPSCPLQGRSAQSVREDLEYLMGRFGGSPSLYRRGGLPVYYVYDSYHISAHDWAQVLTPGEGALCMRRCIPHVQGPTDREPGTAPPCLP